MCLVGVVVRRYIDFLILLIPTPLVSALFCSSIPTFVHFFINVFRSCISYVQPFSPAGGAKCKTVSTRNAQT